MTGLTSYAHQVTGVRDPKLGRTRKPWGFLLHTTGGGLTDLAKRHHTKPIDEAIKVYIASQNGSNGYTWGGPAYVLDHDGELYQIAPDHIVTAHAGGPHRSQYLDGSWVDHVKPATLTAWRRQWPTFKGPYHLFPSKSPNEDFVGCEMIPCGDGFGVPRPGTRFTEAQHQGAIRLGRALAAAHGWPVGWQHTPRLLGHEDVDPIERNDIGGGWDPGWLRAGWAYFDFKAVRGEI